MIWKRKIGSDPLPDALGTGDILVLPEWNRCTRSMTDGIAIIESVHKRGASVKVLDRD
jgi:DNA invertase Pin-like site-specific DNA recombinase